MKHKHYIADYAPTGWIVDVGAHDGLFQSWSAELEQAGRDVLCIEGNPDLEQELARNRKNYVMAAVADEARTAKFYVYTKRPASYTGLHDWSQEEGSCEEVQPVDIVTTTLTDVFIAQGLEDVGALGLDIEGGEYDALLGLDFTCWRPKVVFCENHFTQKYAPIPDFLAAKGYHKHAVHDSLDEAWVLNE